MVVKTAEELLSKYTKKEVIDIVKENLDALGIPYEEIRRMTHGDKEALDRQLRQALKEVKESENGITNLPLMEEEILYLIDLNQTSMDED